MTTAPTIKLSKMANAGMVTVQQDVVTEKSEGYVLKGVVYDDCKQPLADVVVSSGGRTSRTDVNGKFELKGIKATADLTIWADGYICSSN